MNKMPARSAFAADLLRKGNANGGKIFSGANFLHRRNAPNRPVRKIGQSAGFHRTTLPVVCRLTAVVTKL